MNWNKLAAAEKNFFLTYPGGFDHPEMVKIGKKHKMPQMTAFAQEQFSKKQCANVAETCDNMIKLVSRSSMVSLFEKPKFRDFVNGLNHDEQGFLVDALKQMLHGKKRVGFEAMVDLLKTAKLAKWSLLTIIPAYYSPDTEVFVKPTTAKNVISYFEVPELTYHPTPSWDFYVGYRKLIVSMKAKVAKNLSPSNAAFTGFLMFSMDGKK